MMMMMMIMMMRMMMMMMLIIMMMMVYFVLCSIHFDETMVSGGAYNVISPGWSLTMEQW